MKSSGKAHASKGLKAGRTTSMERINFDVLKGKKKKYKQWCLDNDTTITDDLRAHVDSKL